MQMKVGHFCSFSNNLLPCVSAVWVRWTRHSTSMITTPPSPPLQNSPILHLQPAMTPAPPSRRQMTFHLDCRALQLLFPGLILNSPAETTLACIAVFLLAVFFEGLKAGCEVLLHGRQTGPGPDTGAVPMPDGSVQTEMQPSASQQMFSLCHLLQATLHITQVVLSQLLMLLFMSYNGYLCTALAAGAGLGFFLFGRKKAAPVGVPAHCRGCSYSADTPPPSL
ncbi:high affinity copper uptake protein 1-like isoform X7 [Brienomyrus brachyistius]|uniref:high affinity copper uptake protein 1-like isoform X7 n=1 Tax=Brienomyrus brachyistius TaxID=42636 RepID=UPI0020B31876|nr:high affinity copper uptake protein 1-like isoform X7 [Brienomyrus brachyistius]